MLFIIKIKSKHPPAPYAEQHCTTVILKIFCFTD